MSQEDAELLRAVREWKPPEDLHPIAMHAWHLYEKAGMSFPESCVQNIREYFEAYDEDLKGLAEAMEGLIRFMIYTGEHLDDKVTAGTVMDILREYAPKFEPFWQRVAEAMQNEGIETKASYDNFVDADTTSQKKAPKYGEKGPAGSVPLKQMLNPGRPPPWIPKGRK